MNADRFQHFVAIDWSGARGPSQKGIALAVCQAGCKAPELVRPDLRWSRAGVLEWLQTELPANSIVGLDLSPGLPFKDANAYFPGWDQSPETAKQLWRMVDSIASTDPHFAATSFVAHPDARRHFRHGKDDCGDRFIGGAGRLRRTEERQRNFKLSPSSCFNLVGAAQVGKSSLTGMRVLHRLNDAIPVWPFDPVPETGSVIVEIYTSLAARVANIPPGRSKMLTGASLDAALSELGVDPHGALPKYSDHATDAILTAAWLRLAAASPELWNPPGLDEVRHTEGWTFGVP